MTFTESVSTCFNKYASFNGTASRSEYWWFILFCFLVSIGLSLVSDILSGLFSLGVLVPQLSAGARRLHDTDRSGWWQLIWIVPVIGWIVLIVFLAQEGKANRYSQSALPA